MNNRNLVTKMKIESIVIIVIDFNFNITFWEDKTYTSIDSLPHLSQRLYNTMHLSNLDLFISTLVFNCTVFYVKKVMAYLESFLQRTFVVNM